MKITLWLAGLACIAISAVAAPAQGPSSDVMGMHNLGPRSNSPVKGARPDACSYCHAPHSGLNVGLWNQQLTTKNYSMYTSNTEKNTSRQPILGNSTNQCLSCHDGTVAVGTSVAYGSITTTGSMYSADVFNGTMQSSHPFSLTTPLKDNVHLAASLASNGTTADTTGAVKLSHGSVECISCHDPHVQSRDTLSQNFLVKDSSGGQLCLACHDPTRQMSGQVNPLADWATSAHAISTAKVAASANLGTYPTVGTSACISCHAPHNAGGPSRILRGQNEQDCIACHNGGTNITSMPTYANAFAEYGSGKVGHPFPQSTSQHDDTEPALLQNNRHSTCVDCHNSHGSQLVGVFPQPPLMRASQKNIAGISAADGTSPVTPAINQYENCLRCHGTSSGKQALAIYGYFPVWAVSAGDSLNVIPQFALTSTSSHPVMHARNSSLLQPSLMTSMLQLDGISHGRTMGTQILCTDCHNSDDNREFGGTGANGPHGSRWQHILERRYEFNKAVVPGQTVTNLFPTPDTSSAGPYALCGKCHDLPNQILKNTSFSKHAIHINDGFSCSTCHTAHGMGATSATITGERMVNFDMNIVAQYNKQPISYSRATNTCVLVCHGVSHKPNGKTS
ncbi:cytochrome c3 family protein [Occallatibacter riparius]|uniref:Cytochrome c3 family protein n=1 Tax=Occallatibacter riparius TaxID=1002689 RepID=A0A9J7BWN2_9BACT|nr:cytochrome c3 family protein [Occallatibacter riparius]UWZ85429.1 cytochrome c3 family protein [Occallatibacter riparius]